MRQVIERALTLWLNSEAAMKGREGQGSEMMKGLPHESLSLFELCVLGVGVSACT